jgi:hypothetical protein
VKLFRENGNETSRSKIDRNIFLSVGQLREIPGKEGNLLLGVG